MRAALDEAHVGAVEVAIQRELFLGGSFFLADFPEGIAERPFWPCCRLDVSVFLRCRGLLRQQLNAVAKTIIVQRTIVGIACILESARQMEKMKTQNPKSLYLYARIAASLGILVLLCRMTGTAQQPATGTLVLPQFVFGGGWYTAMYFTNLSGGAVSFLVSFYSDLGTPLIVPSLGGSSTQVTITANGTATIEAPNAGALSQGYATFTLPVGVGGYGVFRRSGGGPDQEAVVPFASSSGTTATLTWDEKNLATGVAVVNPSSTAATITITARDASGATIGTSSLTLQPLNHTAAILSAFPGLSGVLGQSGSAQFTASTGNLAVLGLRALGSAITSIPPTVGATAQVAPTFAFKTGRYSSPTTILAGKGAIDIVGPGVADGGATLFSLANAPGADGCTYPNTAAWFVGPIANNPFAARLSKVGITSTALSYGVGDSSGCNNWGPNSLLGFSQIGNTLTIANFTLSGTDQAAPADQITYTLGTATAPSVTPVSSFQAGTYRSPGNILAGKASITLSGPADAGGGNLLWSLANAPGADGCTYPNSATWFVGTIANNPLVAARLSKAGITSTAWSYGVGNSPGCNGWRNNDLLGFSQIGNTLSIANFTRSGTDQATPADQITYILVP